MNKRNNAIFFKNKRGLQFVETIVYVLIAIGTIFLMGWAIIILKEKIFG